MAIKVETKEIKETENNNNSYDVYGLKRLILEILKQSKELHFQIEPVTKTSYAVVINRQRVLYFPKKWLDEPEKETETKSKKENHKTKNETTLDDWDDLE